MLKTVIGRYLLFGVLGVETLLLPYFLSKEVYGEVEFLKFTAFLAQFALFGAGTGYVVRFLKENVAKKDFLTFNFILTAFLHALIVGGIIFIFDCWIIAIISILAIVAITFESVIKVRERYLLAMSFKPILSIVLIFSLPFMLLLDWQLEYYVLMAFLIATVTYMVLTSMKLEVGEITADLRKINLRDYMKNIKSGFMINISTAMVFLFFFIDRAIVRSEFPDRLGDYSLSFSITQLTIVAITAFSYVNLVEFGKEQSDKTLFKKNIFKALRQCFWLYLAIGICSIVFSYGAEKFYNYDAVFETTLLMVVVFGLANVLSSLNAAHLYLGSINFVTILMLVIFTISVVLNFVIPFDEANSYYLLLAKTYGLYLLFSIMSFVVIYRKLGKYDLE